MKQVEGKETESAELQSISLGMPVLKELVQSGWWRWLHILAKIPRL
jgi:hypothetical protein